VHRQKLS